MLEVSHLREDWGSATVYIQRKLPDGMVDPRKGSSPAELAKDEARWAAMAMNSSSNSGDGADDSDDEDDAESDCGDNAGVVSGYWEDGINSEGDDNDDDDDDDGEESEVAEEDLYDD